MKMTLWTVLLALTFLSMEAKAYILKEEILQGRRIIAFSPVFLNPEAFSFEFGFVTKKSLKSFNYHYNTFGKVFIAGETNFDNRHRRSAALGAKLGFILRTQPWFPVFAEFGLGYAKSALQKDPWFGSRDKSIANRDMFLLEASIIYLHHGRVMYRLTHQVNNVDYFTRRIFFSVGGNY